MFPEPEPEPEPESDVAERDAGSSAGAFLGGVGLTSGAVFALGLWAVFVGTAVAGDFSPAGLIAALLVSLSAWLAWRGRRLRHAGWSCGGLVLLFAVMTLTKHLPM
ncbi:MULTISPECIES: hypothetical protein [unclassified Streptomyces]|uniref:hypothetical protein n=1 Tax=unclassified Streptomyces TaxID=2593676 RepID=UPI00382DCCA5